MVVMIVVFGVVCLVSVGVLGWYAGKQLKMIERQNLLIRARDIVEYSEVVQDLEMTPEEREKREEAAKEDASSESQW